jgi:uncharacterized protein YecE (DUF72 family)
VMTDVAGRRDVLHMSLTSSAAMIRFTGNELHPSDFARLDAWAERLAGWFEAGLSELYFFMHQPEESTAPAIANYFIRKLNALCGFELEEWRAPVPPPAPAELQLGLF